MISSTSLDLPQHRAQVAEACLRQSVFPIDMKHLPAREITPLAVDQEMIDAADVYIGIYAYRYGSVAEGQTKSYTELEFDRAVDRGIPCLIFLMSAEHDVRPRDVETSPGAQEKLAAFKARASKGRICKEFKSAEDLRSQVIDALSQWKEEAHQKSEKKPAPDFHPPNLIPKPPEPYIAHPYSLLQTKAVVGRQAELNLLTDWVTTNKAVPASTRVFNLVAIGGMGKSALTWKWFNDIAPNELPKLAGRLWWSFYESDAHWENFIIRALAYVSGQSEKTVRELKAPDREDQLWRILDQQPFLLVLDGLERILLAYARMDAAQMLDEDLDDQTANRVAQAIGLPQSAADSFIGRHQLRLTADHRAGHFLRRLTQMRKSRILITTRLYPTELQCETGAPLPGCFAQFLTGLTDSDALSLWREFKVTGSTEQLLPLFRSFNNYPLLIRALAGEVAAFRGGPGDFDKWRAKNPQFDPTRLPLKNAKTHVLEYALHGLKDEHRKVLHTIAAFRMPATWETLRALLTKSPHFSCGASPPSLPDAPEFPDTRTQPCSDDRALDSVLTELEDRGLVGWDKKANRYDMHPIVRSVVWAGLTPKAKRSLYRGLHTYFDAAPKAADWHQIETLEELTPALELFNVLIGMGEFAKASEVFFHHLDSVTDYRFSASHLRIELLTPLAEIDDLGNPKAGEPADLLSVLRSLGRAFLFAGQPGEAAGYFARGVCLSEQSPLLAGSDPRCLGDLSSALRAVGSLRESQRAATTALLDRRKYPMPFDEATESARLGMILAIRGEEHCSFVVLQRALRIATKRGHLQFEGFVCGAIAQREFWFMRPSAAIKSAEHAYSLARRFAYERDLIRTARICGTAELSQNDIGSALERLHDSLAHARQANFSEEELPTLITLAELHRRKNEPATARELLNQVWDAAERGPYPLFHADALNVLAQIERDEGNHAAAIAAATKAYKLAWCDGISADGKVCYAYHYGLTNARKHLQELGVPEPQLPPFDESKFPPLPNVELNPKDEFWVDPASLESNP